MELLNKILTIESTETNSDSVGLLYQSDIFSRIFVSIQSCRTLEFKLISTGLVRNHSLYNDLFSVINKFQLERDKIRIQISSNEDHNKIGSDDKNTMRFIHPLISQSLTCNI